MIDKERLGKKAQDAGIELTPDMLCQYAAYAHLLDEWGEKMNLTAIREPEAVEDRHFIDSLLLAIQPEVCGPLLDVGTGAGFPGVVLKIYRPNLPVTLMEPTGKRIQFLQALIETLGLTGIETCQQRAEELARGPQREQYQTVVARAVAVLPQLCEYCLPLASVGGVFIPMKGESEEELRQARTAIRLLGGEYHDTRKYTLPDGSRRDILLINKVEHTAEKYPRHTAKIKKQPL